MRQVSLRQGCLSVMGTTPTTASRQARAHVLASRLVDPALDTLVRGAMERYHVPGVAIGMLRAGDIEVAGFGVTSVEHPLKVDGDTLFQIASVTKTMTATVVMRLVERGALDLDAPVRSLHPIVPPA